MNQAITAAEYNAWATFNSQPLSTTPAGAAIAGADTFERECYSSNWSSRSAEWRLPLDFFHVPLPQGFATRDPLTFDIRTLEGFNCIASGRRTTRTSERCWQHTKHAAALYSVWIRVFF